MEKTYYRIFTKFNKNEVYFIEFEFSDDPDGFFMPLTIEADSYEEADAKLKDFLGTDSKQIK